MADDLSKSGGRDRDRININQEYELVDWAKKFGVTTERLKAAVRAVGGRRQEGGATPAGWQRPTLVLEPLGRHGARPFDLQPIA
jgi:hypothetical protein